MANPHKGEHSFEVDGKTYTLRFTADSIVQMEDALKSGIVAIGEELASWEKDPRRIRLGTIRVVFWAGLLDAHPELPLKAAGELLLAAGGITVAAELISKAFELAFPPAKTKGARPPKQQKPGTGPNF